MPTEKDPAVFDPRDPRCKRPYGAVPSGTRVAFALRPPRAEGFSRAWLTARFEFWDDRTVSVPLLWSGLEGGRDLFAGELEKIGLKRVHTGEFFHEFVTTCPRRDEVLQALDGAGILGGLPVEGGLLWCVTEVVSREELDRAVSIIKEVCGA